ncbi:SCP2 sterol-binding domain-containing protein [Pollutimonas sp. H1-120]|uniref:ubiquinone anaerobic biosynthesis accessory factor UbiT n=1 Tax=Pollutimonas sp. H1-120 TaxID=3148824 RepID=UPI003B529669
MTTGNPLFPAPLGKLLSHLPAYPGSLVFTAGLNLMLASHLPADTLRMLQGKALRIQPRDAGVAFDFMWSGTSFKAIAPATQPDLTIAANVHDFYLLMQRREDPDTLFFSRRLSMEGDTELGLLVKNSLDSMDLSAFAPGNFSPARFFRQRSWPLR